MFRYFCSDSDISDEMIRVTGGDSRHLRTILRAEAGQKIAVVTTATEYIAEITGFKGDDVICRILEEVDRNNEASCNIVMCQGIPKQAKMETIIQQNTELGVKGFIPLITERAVVKLSDKEREVKKLSRWRKIAKESAKQSKRNIVPEVEDIMTVGELAEMLRETDATVIVPYELESVKTMREVLAKTSENYYIVIGPEGGFDIKEIELLQGIGAQIVTLGSRILRTETAGVVAASVVLYECNELDIKR